MMLSQHFSLAELTHSDLAVRFGIDNTPANFARLNLDLLARGLESVRTVLGEPMHVSSGYRCPKLNAAVRGAGNSSHLKGLAADFTCSRFGTPLEVARAIRESSVDFDQLIQEGNWIHISFAEVPRRLVLTAHFGPAGTTYTQGV